METGQGSESRESHHVQGYYAIHKLETEGLESVSFSLHRLIDLISLVSEGPKPDSDLKSGEAAVDSPPSLGGYLATHSAEIIKLNDRLLELGAAIANKINGLKQLLY